MKIITYMVFLTALCSQGAMAANVGILSMSPESVVQALSSKDGWVEGHIPDAEAVDLQAITKSTEPLLMRVTVIKRYQEPGCGRIQIDIRQDGVPTKAFTTESFVFPPIQINLCQSGEPPQDAFDVRQATNEAQGASRKAVPQEVQ